MSATGTVVIPLAVLALAVGLVMWWQRSQGGTRASIGPSSIVLLGDSLTEEGDWELLLPGRPVANRGYSGFTTEELVPVAEEVAEAEPAMVVLLTGTNDLRDGRPPDWTERHLVEILDRFERSAPDTTVVVQTLLPRSDGVDGVVAINQRIVAVAAERGLPVIDLYPEFDDGVGGLRSGETRDGLHLTDAGYQRWAGILEPFLAREFGSG